MRKALAAAAKTFSSPPALALDDTPSAGAAPLEGRRRLGGAFLIDIDRIEADPEQPRKVRDATAQAELDASVKRLGILQPITVRFDEERGIYRIISGERRYQAAKTASLPEVPCWVQTPSDDKVLVHQIVENWLRAEMHPYDLADALVRLRDAAGFTQKRIAEETGKSEGEISKLLSLQQLAPEVQKAAREDTTGRITKSHLYAVTKLPPDGQHKFIALVQRDGLTTADLEKLVQREAVPLGHPKRRGAPVKQVRFSTSAATVTVTFRKRDVSSSDVAEALDEARLQVGEGYRKHTA